MLTTGFPGLSALNFGKDNFDLFQADQKRDMRESLERLELAIQQNQNMQTIRNYYHQGSDTASSFVELKEQITDTVAEGVAVGVGVVVGTGCCFIPGVNLVGGALLTASFSFAARYGTKKAMLGNNMYGMDDVSIDAGVSAVEGVVDITGATVALKSIRYTALARRGFGQIAKTSTTEVGGRAFMKNTISNGIKGSDDALRDTAIKMATELGQETGQKLGTKEILALSDDAIIDLVNGVSYRQAVKALNRAGGKKLQREMQDISADTFLQLAQRRVRDDLTLNLFIDPLENMITAPAMGAFYTATDKNTWENGWANGISNLWANTKNTFQWGMAFSAGFAPISMFTTKFSRINRNSRTVSPKALDHQLRRRTKIGQEGVDYLKQQNARKGFVTQGDVRVARRLKENSTPSQQRKLQQKYDYIRTDIEVTKARKKDNGETNKRLDAENKRRNKRRPDETEAEYHKRLKEEAEARRKRRGDDEPDGKSKRPRKRKKRPNYPPSDNFGGTSSESEYQSLNFEEKKHESSFTATEVKHEHLKEEVTGEESIRVEKYIDAKGNTIIQKKLYDGDGYLMKVHQQIIETANEKSAKKVKKTDFLSTSEEKEITEQEQIYKFTDYVGEKTDKNAA